MVNEHTDPTENVLMLVEAAVKRIDDLRDAESRRVDGALEDHQAHIRDLMTAESNRLDAIREIDTTALSNANERVAQQAIVLAAQLAESTATLRNEVNSTIRSEADQRKQVTDQLENRVKTLEESRYELRGTSGGRKEIWALIVGGVLFMLAVAGFILNRIG